MPLIASNISWKASTSCLNGSLQEEEIMATLLGSYSPQTGGKPRNCSSNIVTRFTGSKITGQGFSRGTQVRGRSRGSVVRVSQCWSGEAGDSRLEPCRKLKTLSGGVGWGGCRRSQPWFLQPTVTLRRSIAQRKLLCRWAVDNGRSCLANLSGKSIK